MIHHVNISLFKFFKFNLTELPTASDNESILLFFIHCLYVVYFCSSCSDFRHYFDYFSFSDFCMNPCVTSVLYIVSFFSYRSDELSTRKKKMDRRYRYIYISFCQKRILQSYQVRDQSDHST